MGDFEHAVIGRAHVIRLIGDFTEDEHATILSEELRRSVPVEAPCLVVNWAKIKSVSARVLWALIAGIERPGSRVRHCSLSTRNLEMLKILMHVDHFPNVFETEGEAIDSCVDAEQPAGR